MIQSQGDAIAANDAIAAGQGEDPDPQTPGTQGEENLSSEETDSDSDLEPAFLDVVKLTGQDSCSQGDLWDPHSSYRRGRDDESSEAELDCLKKQKLTLTLTQSSQQFQ